jgi:cell division protease FtsH
MVMDFGMSGLGRVNYRESHRSPFLAAGGDYGRSSSHSEQTAREIDEEVKRILDEMLNRVRHILAERRQSLEAVTKALMEQETIDSDELKRIMEETTSGARIVPGTEAEPKRAALRPSAEDLGKDKEAGAGLKII